MTRSVPILLALLGAAAALPDAAAAAVTCAYDPVDRRLDVLSTADADHPGVMRDGAVIRVTKAGDTVGCTGADPTVTNTDSIRSIDTAPGDGSFTVDLSGGPLAPGYSGEGTFGTPEIEVEVQGGMGHDDLRIEGSSGPDTVRAGTYDGYQTRLNLNPGDLIPDADVLATGVERVLVDGGGGDDVLDARGGAGTFAPLGLLLTVYGEGDDDTIHSGGAPSVVVGGEGDDTLVGNDAPDSFAPGPGDDAVTGGGAVDSIRFDLDGEGVRVDIGDPDPQDTGQGVDTLTGLETLYGTDEDDELHGGAVANSIFAGDGDDILEGEGGDDTLDGEQGRDVVDYRETPGGIVLSLAGPSPQATGAAGDDHVTMVEDVIGTGHGDSITGDVGGNRIEGRGGADVLSGAGGADTLLPGRGAELEPDGADTVDGGSGVDTVSYADRKAPVAIRLDGIKNDGADPDGDGLSEAGEEADHVKNVENATGGTAGDRLRGSGGANVLTGADGADVLDGGLGADILDGGLGLDTLSYAARATAVAIRLDGTKNDGADPDGDGFSSAAEEGDHAKGIENATGGSGPDRLFSASTVINVLTGGGGADHLDAKDGSAKADVMNCGSGADQHRSDPADTKTSCETAIAKFSARVARPG